MFGHGTTKDTLQSWTCVVIATSSLLHHVASGFKTTVYQSPNWSYLMVMSEKFGSHLKEISKKIAAFFLRGGSYVNIYIKLFG